MVSAVVVSGCVAYGLYLAAKAFVGLAELLARHIIRRKPE